MPAPPAPPSPLPTDPGLPPPCPTQSFWQHPPHPLHNHRTTPTLPTTVDTLIIGSGLAGTLLYHHLQRPPSTLILEARSTCSGATGRNGGHCKPMLYQAGFFDAHLAALGPRESLTRIRFEQLNLQLLRELAAATPCDWQERESADVYYTPRLLDAAKRSVRALVEAAPEMAGKVRVVEGRGELRELRVPTAVGAVVFAAATLWPYRMIAGVLEEGVRGRGLNLQTGTAVEGVRRGEGGWEVRTGRGTVVARRVVVAANAYTAHLLPQFQGWVYPVRAQMVALRPPRSMRERPLTASYALVREDRRTADYLMQRPVGKDGSGGELMFGGGRQLEVGNGVGLGDDAVSEEVGRYLRRAVPGYFAGEEGYGEEESVGRSFIADFRRLRLTSRRIGGVWDAAEGLGFGDSETDDDYEAPKKKEVGEEECEKECEAVMEWSGTMGFSRDERPFVGRVPPVFAEDAEERGIPEMPDTKGLWVLAGFEGHGMALAAGSAKALALMMEAEDNDMDVDDELRLYDWFPRSFETSSARIGLREGPERDDEWVMVEQQ